MRAMTWTVAAALILILAAGICCGWYSRDTSEELRGLMKGVSRDIEQREWETAIQKTGEITRQWEDTSAILAMWVNHEDVDEVSIGLSQLMVSLRERESYHALLYAAELEESLSHLYHRDAFALKNIL